MTLKLVEKHKSPSHNGIYILIQKQELKKGGVTYITVPENYDGRDISKVGNFSTLTAARIHLVNFWGCSNLAAQAVSKVPQKKKMREYDQCKPGYRADSVRR